MKKHQVTNSAKERKVIEIGEMIAKALVPDCVINWNPDPFYVGFTWDGKTLNCSEHNPIYGVHDIVHMMFASKNRLKKPEFGLGEDPSGSYNWEDGKSIPKRVVAANAAQAEEEEVCDFHISLLLYCCGPEEADEMMDYLSSPELPTIKLIKSYGEKFKYLPKDFVEKTLERRMEFIQKYNYLGAK